MFGWKSEEAPRLEKAGGCLMTSLALGPLAPLGIWLGVRLHKVIPRELFYRLCYALLFVNGVKLLWDGLAGKGWLGF